MSFLSHSSHLSRTLEKKISYLSSVVLWYIVPTCKTLGVLCKGIMGNNAADGKIVKS